MRTGRGTTKAEDSQGTPTQSHISPSILVYEDKSSSAAPGKASLGEALNLLFFFSSSLLSSLESSDTKVYEPKKRARLGTAAHFCEVVGGFTQP